MQVQESKQRQGMCSRLQISPNTPCQPQLLMHAKQSILCSLGCLCWQLEGFMNPSNPFRLHSLAVDEALQHMATGTLPPVHS